MCSDKQDDERDFKNIKRLKLIDSNGLMNDEQWDWSQNGTK